ncbi:SMI1/KNR4 family protein [Aeromonas hydrophila]|uniref:SMI1/KNR4 family protein n=1 Tax=Aeromonas hydrophila TaxID=644 RepID=UPI001A27AD6A|nr:SMI1/KNR4 family protein [Aeromonas hydrophila]EHA1066653.1 SMI1/KNR4 family protein [Aeromonas hydrophila]MBX9565864.1 SMI1/KNR4 family protein [Aeromonas hydrophila]MDD9228612.1 SMI1/KNR4 family protein [Aeromonas hydrophila]HAT1553259.1 SMI1/KNR4 family protein [Aeromonas hydrophila]
MRELIQRIGEMENCKVLPPSGIPDIDIPSDLKEFYSLCGGVILFETCDYWFKISSPEELIPANPYLLPEEYEKDIPKDDISNNFYIIARNGPEQAISINLGDSQFGYCYDSFWELHATSESSIIAYSFTFLLNSLIKSKGSYPYWLNSNFVSLGHLYN